MLKALLLGTLGLSVIMWLYKRLKKSETLTVQEGDAVVVTGAGSGIGKATALELNKAGFTVFAGVMSKEEGAALNKSAADQGRMIPIVLDVTKTSDIQSALEKVTNIVGSRGLRGLFSNAGVSLPPNLTEEEKLKGLSVESLPISAHRDIFEINYFGSLAVTRAFIPLLRQAKGTIIFTSSITGLMGMPFVSPYCASKHAIESLGDSLRRELHSKGVKVSIMECGAVGTMMWRAATQIGIPYQSDYWEDEISERMVVTDFPVVPAEVPAGVVKRILLTPKPRPRYRVNLDLPLWKFPDRVADALLRGAASKHKPKEGEDVQAMMDKYVAKYSPYWEN